MATATKTKAVPRRSRYAELKAMLEARHRQLVHEDCFECGEEIAEARLFALPFAVRCEDCEEAHETVQQRKRIVEIRGGSSTLGFDVPPQR